MREHYYLDNASTSWPKPEEVYRAMDEAARRLGASPGRGQYSLASDAEQLVADTRHLLASLFNHRSDVNRVIFAQNGTDALNVAIIGLVEDGDHIVTTRLEHNSVLRPLQHLRASRNVRLTFVGRDPDGYLLLDDLRRSLTTKTKAVVVNHGSNVLGSVQDLKAVGEIVRASGASLIVDASQTAGLCEINIDALGIDLLAFAGHKGLMGPMGIGALIVGQKVDLAPLRHGGTGIESRSPRQPERYPHRLEAGTLALPAIAGLNAALRWLAEQGRTLAGSEGGSLTRHQACSIAIRHIEAKQHSQRQRLADALRGIDGVVVYGPRGDQPRLSTMSFNVIGLDAEQAAAVLDADFHVCVRAGLHCAPLVHEDEGTIPEFGGTVRLSLGAFTDDEDLAQVVRAIPELATLGRELVHSSHPWDDRHANAR